MVALSFRRIAVIADDSRRADRLATRAAISIRSRRLWSAAPNPPLLSCRVHFLSRSTPWGECRSTASSVTSWIGVVGGPAVPLRSNPMSRGTWLPFGSMVKPTTSTRRTSIAAVLVVELAYRARLLSSGTLCGVGLRLDLGGAVLPGSGSRVHQAFVGGGRPGTSCEPRVSGAAAVRATHSGAESPSAEAFGVVGRAGLHGRCLSSPLPYLSSLRPVRGWYGARF
jgi:hypothetical protein